MRVAIAGTRHRDGGQSQSSASDTEAGHQSSRGVDRSSDESDRTGKHIDEYDALAAESMVPAGSTSLYNARATDALVTERLRARQGGKHSRERQRRAPKTTTRDDAEYAVGVPESAENAAEYEHLRRKCQNGLVLTNHVPDQ